MVSKRYNSLGFYEPSFFRLHVETINPVGNLKQLNDKDTSVFYHEYMHFIQDITTFYGLNNIYVIAEHLRYGNNHIINSYTHEFEVPVYPDPSNEDNLLLNERLCDDTYGDADPISNIKEISSYSIINRPIDVPNCAIKEVNVVLIKYIDKMRKENIYRFGAACIIESMAYIFEQLTCIGYLKSPELPYLSAELIAKYIYPEFAKSKENIFALCDVSLNSSNPAEYYVKTLEHWKIKNEIPSDPAILYEIFRTNNFSMNGTASSYNEQYLKLLQTVRSQLLGYFNDSLFDGIIEWIDAVLYAAKDYRISNPAFMLEFIKYDIKSNRATDEFMINIGTPLISNSNNDFVFLPPRTCSGSIDIGMLWAISQVYDVLLGRKYSCKLMNYCNQSLSKVKTDMRCENEPWMRCNESALCPFAVIWKHWGLENHRPK